MKVYFNPADGEDKTAYSLFYVDENRKMQFVKTMTQKEFEDFSSIDDKKLKCVGGIIGDIIGQRFEWHPHKSKDFKLWTVDSRFTDDTVMTCGIMDWLANNGDLAETLKKWGRMFPKAGYGGHFRQWLAGGSNESYGSYGNGSGMRVSPVGWAAQNIEECLELAEESAKVTHNHPEGIKGAQAIASAIFMARTGNSKEEIKDFISSKFEYNMNRTLEEIRPNYKFEVSCQKSVPESIICFLEGNNYEDCVRNAVSLGGDSDTQADMAGAIAEAYSYEIDTVLYKNLFGIWLPEDMQQIIKDFNEKFIK